MNGLLLLPRCWPQEISLESVGTIPKDSFHSGRFLHSDIHYLVPYMMCYDLRQNSVAPKNHHGKLLAVVFVPVQPLYAQKTRKSNDNEDTSA